MFSKPSTLYISFPLVNYSKHIQLALFVSFPGKFESVFCELDQSEIQRVSLHALFQLPDLGSNRGQVALPFVLDSSGFRHTSG